MQVSIIGVKLLQLYCIHKQCVYGYRLEMIKDQE